MFLENSLSELQRPAWQTSEEDLAGIISGDVDSWSSCITSLFLHRKGSEARNRQVETLGICIGIGILVHGD